jgi:hypothetical protein
MTPLAPAGFFFSGADYGEPIEGLRIWPAVHLPTVTLAAWVIS